MSESPNRTTTLSRTAVLVPAATFLIGLALGWALVAVSQTDEPESSAEPVPESSEPTPTTPSEGDILMRVPAACQQSAENLREAATLLRESVRQVRDFDPDRLVETLNRLEAIDEETRPLIADCSDVSMTRSPADGPTVDESPSPTG